MLYYLHQVSFVLFNTEDFLASYSENRLSLLCNLLWWVGAGISAAFPSACIRPPLQWFSNERHLLCNAHHLHFGKCAWEHILVFKISWYLWLYLHLILGLNSVSTNDMGRINISNISRAGTLVLLVGLYHLPPVPQNIKSSILLTKKKINTSNVIHNQDWPLPPLFKALFIKVYLKNLVLRGIAGIA